MDNLGQLSAQVGMIGETARQQAAYLQAMSQRASQLSMMLDSYIRGTAGNEAAEICAALNLAGDEIMKACHALMQAFQVSQQWLSSHVPSAPVSLPPLFGPAAFVVPAQAGPDANPDAAGPAGSPQTSAQPASSREAADEATMQGYRKITSSHTATEDLKNTNPKYAENTPYDVNCQRCVSAYEARRRGYDVTAAPLLDENDPLQMMRHPQGWASVYEGAQLIDCSSRSGTGTQILVDEKMAAWGDGARAIVRVRWKLGGGHVFIAERVDGRTRYVDPQQGTVDAAHYFQFAKGSGTFCVRIDDLPFTNRIHDCIV